MSVATLAAPAPVLNAGDRCDRCQAQAFVMTTMPSGLELLWCGHHFARNEAKLVAAGATVATDSRHTLNS